MERGLIFAVAAMMLWGLLDASNRYAVVALGADPWVFSCMNLITGALILLAIAGKGQGGLETLRHGHTWVFGFFRVLMTLFLVFAFTAVSASEANFMLRINVVMALFAAWVVLGRKPTWTDMPGLLVLIGGYSVMVARQQDGLLNWAVILVILAAVCDTIMTMIAEVHPASKKASGLKARCRYTGVVLLVTSVFFCMIAYGIAELKVHITDPTLLDSAFGKVLSKAPSLSSFTHPGTLISAVVIGLVLRAPSMYLYLYAARLMKSENLIMIATLSPFATLAAESIFVSSGWLQAATLDTIDVLAGVCMTCGAVSMILLRIIRKRRKTLDI